MAGSSAASDADIVRLEQEHAKRMEADEARQAEVEKAWMSAGEPAWEDVDGPIEGGLRVFSSRQTADKYNELMVRALPGKHHSFKATDHGDLTVLAESVAPAALGLRLHARVLCLKNIDARCRIGSAGYISNFEYRKNAAGQVTDVGIVVEFAKLGRPASAAGGRADRPFKYTFATALSPENTFSAVLGDSRQFDTDGDGLLSAEEIQAIEGATRMPPPPTTQPLVTAHHTTRLCTPSSSPLALAHARS